MTITQNDHPTQGQFVAEEDGQQAGFLDYTWTGEDHFTIEHVEVDPAFGGRGVGKKLVMAAADFARERQLKIKPRCGFSASVLNKFEETRDLIY